MASATVIEIEAKVSDQTASGISAVEKSLAKWESSLKKVQGILSSVIGNSKVELTATLLDSASGGLEAISNFGSDLAGKVWTVSMDVLDEATAPMEGLFDLLNTPLVPNLVLPEMDVWGDKDSLEQGESWGSSFLSGVSSVLNKGFSALDSSLLGNCSVNSSSSDLSTSSITQSSSFNVVTEQGGNSSLSYGDLQSYFSSFYGGNTLGGSGENSGVSSAVTLWNWENLGGDSLSSSASVSGGSSVEYDTSKSMVTNSLVEGSLYSFQESLGQLFSVEIPDSFQSLCSAVTEQLSSSKEETGLVLQESVSEFFTQSLPLCFQELWSGTQEVLASSKEESSLLLGEGISGFFQETLTDSMSSLWSGTEELLLANQEASAVVLGEGISGFLGGLLPEAMTSLWLNTGETLAEQSENSSILLSEGISQFFAESLPVAVTDLFLGANELLLTSKEESGAVMGQGISGFFGVEVPDSLESLWTFSRDMMTEQGVLAQEFLGTGISEFFVVSIPEAVKCIWDSALIALETGKNSAMAVVNSGITAFFSSASSSVNGFFAQAQSKVNAAMATSAAALSSLSVGYSSGAVSSSGVASAYANGGILSTPHLGLVAEDGPEAIIPLSGKRRGRGIELWQQAGEKLGVGVYGKGGMLGAYASGEQLVPNVSNTSASVENSVNNPVNIAVNVGGFSQNIKVDGDGNESNIVAQMKENIGLLTDEIALHLANSLRQVYANMPLIVDS